MKANLLKLQGLVLMEARQDKLQEALKCFEVASKKFGKIGNKQTANLGVA